MTLAYNSSLGEILSRQIYNICLYLQTVSSLAWWKKKESIRQKRCVRNNKGNPPVETWSRHRIEFQHWLYTIQYKMTPAISVVLRILIYVLHSIDLVLYSLNRHRYNNARNIISKVKTVDTIPHGLLYKFARIIPRSVAQICQQKSLRLFIRPAGAHYNDQLEYVIKIHGGISNKADI